MVRLISLAFTCFSLGLGSVQAQDAAGMLFAVGEIRIEGLQRISEGTVYNYLPINIGDALDPRRLREAIGALYATHLFRDVEMRRDGATLVVAVRERPTIESFEVKGNKDIKTEDLERSLRGVGLAAGKAFDQSVLDEVRQYLSEQYFARGKYAARIDAHAEETPDNKVRVAIDIVEGKRARIRQINITGNGSYADEELLQAFQLDTPNWLSWYRQDDRYAREALTADIEALRSYYMDRGYADFAVTSTQVAVAPEKDDMFVTINVHEGAVYRVSQVKLAGEMVIAESELRRLVQVAPGATFSRKQISLTSEAISQRLGLDGYAFAKVDAVPQPDPLTKQLALTFVVDPGHRTYVRRVNFHGSASVNDDVFRRELRQQEGSYLSNAALERSKQRIQRLPFVEKVAVETTLVPGTPDLVDVDFAVEEGLPGQFGGGIGYSPSQSVSLNANLVHANFLGRGERVALELNAGRYSQTYDISHTQPYLTPAGISRTFNLAYRDVSRLSSASSDFSSQSWLAGLEIGYPLSEYQSLQLGAVWQHSELATTLGSSRQFQDWVAANGDSFQVGQDDDAILGTRYDNVELSLGWTFDSRDRLVFPTRGATHRFTLSATPPGVDIEYFTTRYDFLQFITLPGLSWLPLSFGGRVSYATAFGDTSALPPQRNFFAGGAGTVRGFHESRLGPRDSLGNPYGGDFSVSGQVEAILPLPERFARSARVALFYDFGQLAYLGDTRFTDKLGAPVEYDFDFASFRTAAGIGVEWLAPLGLFRFSYAVPLRFQRGTDSLYGDQLDRFQFSIGRAF